MRRRLMLQRLQAQQEPVAEVVVEKRVPAPEAEAPQEVKAPRDKPAPRSWEKKEKKGKK